MNILAIIFLAVITICNLSMAQTNDTHTIQRHLFPVWQTDSEVYLAAEIAIEKYPEHTLMSKILSDKITNKFEPELLVIREFEATLKADTDSILQNYYDEKGKEYAKLMIKDIDKIRKYNTEIASDLLFTTKSQFADIYRIKYKTLTKDHSFAMPWASYCKKIDGHYYFVSLTPETSLLTTLSEACPYWDKSKQKLSKEQIQNLSSLTISPKTLDSDLNQNTRIDLFINIKKFSSSTEINFHKEVIILIEKMQKAYTENKKNSILSLWLPERQQIIKGNLENNGIFKETQNYFSQTDKFILDFYVGTFDDSFVFARRMVNGQIEENSLKILKFKRQNGTLYFTDFPSDYCYLAGNILENPLMLPFYKQIIEANTKH